MINCSICRSPITGRYLIDPYGRPCHEYHGSQASEHCYSCRKLCDPKSMVHYNDGRKICNKCHCVAVNTIESGKLAHNHVLKLYSHAKLPLPKDRIELFINDQIYAKLYLDKNSFHGLMRYTRKTSFKGVDKKYKVFIINGLHPVVFNGVLAHEFMHVFLREHDYKLDLIDEEGLCELMAYFALKASKTSIGNVIADLIATNQDPIYGAGFRKIKALYDKQTDIHKLLETMS